MKVGDKLLCKKTHNDYDMFGSDIVLTVGRYYKICNFSVNYYVISTNNINISIWCSENNKGYIDIDIWEYFYTPQEERKIKIEKLNESTL